MKFAQGGKSGAAYMALSEREGLDLWRRALTASVRSDAPDMTARQQAILMIVALTPGPHTVRGLAELLDIAKPAVTRALDALGKAGLVTRSRDLRDQRSVLVERTVDGMAYLRAHARLIVAAAEGELQDEPKQQKQSAAA